MTLNNAFVAAALAGKVCGTESWSAPVTGSQLSSFSIPDELWNESEKNILASAGVTVVESRNSFVTIRHALTTDMTSADTSEISVVSLLDRVRKVTRDQLTARFLGKGLTIDDALLGSIEAAVGTIWTGLIDDDEIAAYGTTNNPITGEIPIAVTQDASEPRRIHVVGSVSPLYPVTWIDVDLTTYV